MDFERLQLDTPAKVNLYLNVYPQPVGGFHQLTSVFHTVDLCDTVLFERSNHFEVVTCGMDIAQEDNLAYKAGLAFARVCGTACCIGEAFIEREDGTFEPPFRVTITKRIPAQAGLGGGSADAAAVIYGLAYMYDGVDTQGRIIFDLARTLGSDVAFFLQGGAAYMEGRGDRLTRLINAVSVPVVLVKPQGGVSTAQAYQLFDTQEPKTADPEALIEALDQEDAKLIGESLFNNLEPAAMAIEPSLETLSTFFKQEPGVYGSLVSGSGSCMFAICESEDCAARIAEASAAKGYFAYATRTCAEGIRVVAEEHASAKRKKR